MFTTIILAATICSTDVNQKCDVSFEHTFVSANSIEFKKDANECFAILEAYPQEQHLLNGKIITRGCYSVEKNSGQEGYAYLENMLDKDDSFMPKLSNVQIN